MDLKNPIHIKKKSVSGLSWASFSRRLAVFADQTLARCRFAQGLELTSNLSNTAEQYTGPLWTKVINRDCRTVRDHCEQYSFIEIAASNNKTETPSIAVLYRFGMFSSLAVLRGRPKFNWDLSPTQHLQWIYFIFIESIIWKHHMKFEFEFLQ